MFRNLGHSIKLLREIAGLTLDDVAKGAGIEKDHLAKFEKGRELPSLEALRCILLAIGADFNLFAETLAFVDGRVERLRATAKHRLGQCTNEGENECLRT